MICRPDVFKLLTNRLGPCISLYMPTRRGGPATREDLVRYQNLLRGVENDLILRGCTPANAEEMLAHAKALVEDAPFWQTDSEGVALFIAPDFFMARRFLCAVRTTYRIGKRFHIRPLLPLLDSTRRFYILALDQDSARFFEATPRSMCELPLGEPAAEQGPASPETRRFATESRSRSLAVAMRSSRPVASADPAGDRFRAEREEADLMQFLRSVDRHVAVHLRGERAPLVLACIGFLARLYEGVNSYGRLLPVKVPGNPLNWTTDELHAQAHRIIEPYLERDRLEARARFETAAGLQLATADTATIVAAADEGRIDTLFLTDGDDCRGDFDSGGDANFFDAAGDDLAEVVAGKTLLDGGRLCILETQDMPGRRPLAAILRSAAEAHEHQS